MADFDDFFSKKDKAKQKIKAKPKAASEKVSIFRRICVFSCAMFDY
jgi:hypothetical protein